MRESLCWRSKSVHSILKPNFEVNRGSLFFSLQLFPSLVDILRNISNQLFIITLPRPLVLYEKVQTFLYSSRSVCKPLSQLFAIRFHSAILDPNHALTKTLVTPKFGDSMSKLAMARFIRINWSLVVWRRPNWANVRAEGNQGWFPGTTKQNFSPRWCKVLEFVKNK